MKEKNIVKNKIKTKKGQIIDDVNNEYEMENEKSENKCVSEYNM